MTNRQPPATADDIILGRDVNQECVYFCLEYVDKLLGKGRKVRDFKEMNGGKEGVAEADMAGLLEKAGFEFEVGKKSSILPAVRDGDIPLITVVTKMGGHAVLVSGYENINNRQNILVNILDPQLEVRDQMFSQLFDMIRGKTFIIKGYLKRED